MPDAGQFAAGDGEGPRVKFAGNASLTLSFAEGNTNAQQSAEENGIPFVIGEPGL